MKYVLEFDKFAKLILESLVKEMEVDEANICKNSGNWTLIDDRNIGTYRANYPKVAAVMDYLKNKYPDNILSFKLSPSIKPDQNVYELYVNVNTSSVNGLSYTTDRQSRTALYNIIKKDIDWSNAKDLDTVPIIVDNKTVDYKIGSAEKRLESQFQNPKNIKLSEFKIATILQNSIAPIGLFIETENGLELDTVVLFRMEELKGDKSGNKKQLIETHVKNAASLISSIFGGNEQIISRGVGGISPEDFSQSLLNNLKGMNVPDSELNAYTELFGAPFFDNLSKYKSSGFNPTTLTAETKEFLLKTNALMVISEIIIPWVLINGIKKFSGVDLINALLGKKSNDTVVAVSWPKSATNQNTDYSVSFAKFNSGQEVGISAKSEGGHLTSAMSAILNASKTDKDKFIALENLLGKCARTVYNVQEKWSNSTAVFYCWCIASVVKFDEEMTIDNFNDLRELYTLLTTSKERILPDDFETKTIKELGGSLDKTGAEVVKQYFCDNYKDKKDLTFDIVEQQYPRALNAWPYSLTNVCERVVVAALNDGTGSNSSRSTFYGIKMGGDTAYHQIELYRDAGNIINLKCKPPKNAGAGVDNTSSVTFKVATGSGNKTVNAETNASICNGIAKSSGSHGSVIAVKLND